MRKVILIIVAFKELWKMAILYMFKLMIEDSVFSLAVVVNSEYNTFSSTFVQL